MSARVPVLRKDDMLEAPRELIHEGDDLVAFVDGERPARAEVILEVDDEECVAGLHINSHDLNSRSR